MTHEWSTNECAKEIAIVDLSVVMPTHNRADVLERVLTALASELAILDRPAEIVVCDDASSDHTRAVLGREWNAPLTWTSLPQNAGPAKARNAALAQARGRVVLFLGDDIEPGPGLLQKHLQWHDVHSGDGWALLGRTTWPPQMNVTLFMRFLEGRGRAFFFDYLDLPEGTPISGSKFYTCNVSIKRKLYEEVGGFDENFPFASHEDLEYGLRLERAGMRLVYDASAVGYHWHELNLRGTVRRVYLNGRSSVYYWTQVPDHAGVSRRVARRWCCMVARCFPYPLIQWASRLMPRPGWYGLLALAYWRGSGDATRTR